MKNTIQLALAGSLFLALSAMSPAQAGVDAAQAESLMRADKCGSCHHPTRTRGGPSLKSIAEKYEGKDDAVATLITFMTTGPTIVDEDGEEDEHKIVRTKNQAELENLARWILAQGDAE
jgi:cytochrome c